MDQSQQPPMNGNDELAKALNDTLQFEETPAPGAADQAPTLQPGAQMGDPLAGMAMPALSDDEPKTDDTPTPPADDEASEPSQEEPGLPAVHHGHEKHNDANKAANIDAVQPPADDTQSVAGMPSTGDKALDKIKSSALEELKPLVGKLDLPAEEKFDTLLLVLRSTDDQSLLDEAYNAAKNITDETKRAQALLDIIKEVDYFSSKR